MIRDLATLLFPAEPRSFPGRRGLKILLRAAHVLFAGVLLGSYVFDVDAGHRGPWFLATIGSGSLLLLLDLHESAVFLLQVRGLVVVAKIALLACLPLFAGREAWVLGWIVLVSMASSHAPAKIRYAVMLGAGKVRPSRSKG